MKDIPTKIAEAKASHEESEEKKRQEIESVRQNWKTVRGSGLRKPPVYKPKPFLKKTEQAIILTFTDGKGSLSPLMLLPYSHKNIASTFDVMHNLFLGNVKNFFQKGLVTGEYNILPRQAVTSIQSVVTSQPVAPTMLTDDNSKVSEQAGVSASGQRPLILSDSDSQDGDSDVQGGHSSDADEDNGVAAGVMLEQMPCHSPDPRVVEQRPVLPLALDIATVSGGKSDSTARKRKRSQGGTKGKQPVDQDFSGLLRPFDLEQISRIMSLVSLTGFMLVHVRRC